MVRRLLDGIGSLDPWRLTLVADVDRCQVWMGPEPSTATEPGSFARAQVGHFVLRGPEGQVRDLFPFLCYLPAPDDAQRLHYYDSLHRYKAAGKDALALEYDEGFKQARPEPVAGLEEAFTAELLAEKFGRHRGKMEVIEGRVASFGALIDEHAAIVGRRFVIDQWRGSSASTTGASGDRGRAGQGQDGVDGPPGGRDVRPVAPPRSTSSTAARPASPIRTSASRASITPCWKPTT